MTRPTEPMTDTPNTEGHDSVTGHGVSHARDAWLPPVEAVEAAARAKYERYDSHFSMPGGMSWEEYAADDPDGAEALYRADAREDLSAAFPFMVGEAVADRDAEIERLQGMLDRTEEQIHDDDGFISTIVDQQAEVERLRRDLAEAESDRDRNRESHDRACVTVAEMYEAATGSGEFGPKRGVIEDLRDIRNQRDDARAEVARLAGVLAKVEAEIGIAETEFSCLRQVDAAALVERCRAVLADHTAALATVKADAWRAGFKYSEASALGHAVEHLVKPGSTPYDRPTKEEA